MKPLLLWGGTDIASEIYFEEPLSTTDKPDISRDSREIVAVVEAIDSERPIIGICRGAQLLCALNGGKLDQHNPKHKNNSHGVLIYDVGVDDYIHYIGKVAADHHQIMIPAGEHDVIAVSDFDGVPEVVWWPETKCLAVQPHPEWMASSHPFNVWLNELLVTLGIEHTF